MSDGTAPDLLESMAEALTATFTGHPQRRSQALAANRVLAERMWPPVKAALNFRDVQIAGLVELNRQSRDDLRTYLAGVERLQDLTSRLRADYRAEIKQRTEAFEAAREAAEDLEGRRRQDHQAEIAEAEEQIRTAEAERDQALTDLETAKGWRDTALAERDKYRRANAQLQELATLRGKERDQLKAAVDRVRQLHSRALPAPNCADPGCDYCGDEIWPCSTIAALDRSDLPAVRERAAEFDPRGEPT